MSPSSRSTFVKTSVVALLIAVLYRYWLVTPVLQYLSIAKWYLVAIAVAAGTGCLVSLLRLPTPALVCASMAGLLLGGTWVAWKMLHNAQEAVSEYVSTHRFNKGRVIRAFFLRRREPCPAVTRMLRVSASCGVQCVGPNFCLLTGWSGGR